VNKLLERQIKKHLGNIDPDEKWAALLQAVSDSYDHYERDRALIERSNEISSIELQEANQKLLNEKREITSAINSLIESIRILKNNQHKGENEIEPQIDLLRIADIVKAESQSRKKAEEELRKNLNNLKKINKDLDQFAYVVSHDLKAPLRAISSLAEWIEEDSQEQLTEESLNNLKTLRGRVLRMENLISGILAYTKAGKNKTEPQKVDLQSLIGEIIDSINPPPSIKIETSGEWPAILTESTKLQQVLSNLLSNAVKYMDKQHGQIRIGCITLENCIQCYVEDNGPGIEEEYHDKIFQLFQTLSSRDQVESTGIGLSIVKRIIEEQGGKIWINSKPGQGSRFTFMWPVTYIEKTTKQYDYR
jgi:signal transduction histidine kinase